MTLDNSQHIAKIDRSNMRKLLQAFPEQLAQAWELSTELPTQEFEKIVICGMGGSAIGGDYLRVYLQQKGFSKPITVVRGYELPSFADKNTLVFAVSYSGNTEETLSCAQQALKLGCPLIAITSGGKLAQLAREHSVPVVKIPSGMPPRTALAFLFAPILRSLLPLLHEATIEQEVSEAVETLQPLAATYGNKPETENPAKQLARAWHERIPIIYGSSGLTEAVAHRWKTQINENAKQPAHWDLLPELHHNEIMGWESPLSKRFVYVLLRNPDEHPQVQKRFQITRELLEERDHTVLEFQGQGQGLLSRLLTLSYLGDWASFYLAILNGVDPTPVALIETMKRRLAQS